MMSRNLESVDMSQVKYQITLSIAGNHSVSVTGDDQEAVNEGLAWARGIYLKLQERAKQSPAAPSFQTSETVNHQVAAPEQPPTCAIHNKTMVSVNGKKGQFWSCHEKLADQSWCPYKPPREAVLSSR
jgi:hypothetical protein